MVVICVAVQLSAPRWIAGAGRGRFSDDDVQSLFLASDEPEQQQSIWAFLRAGVRWPHRGQRRR